MTATKDTELESVEIINDIFSAIGVNDAVEWLYPWLQQRKSRKQSPSTDDEAVNQNMNMSRAQESLGRFEGPSLDELKSACESMTLAKYRALLGAQPMECSGC
jgi:hypothetical protein